MTAQSSSSPDEASGSLLGPVAGVAAGRCSRGLHGWPLDSVDGASRDWRGRTGASANSRSRRPKAGARDLLGVLMSPGSRQRARPRPVREPDPTSSSTPRPVAAAPVPDRLEASVRGPGYELGRGGRRDVDAGGETGVREPHGRTRRRRPSAPAGVPFFSCHFQHPVQFCAPPTPATVALPHRARRFDACRSVPTR